LIFVPCVCCQTGRCALLLRTREASSDHKAQAAIHLLTHNALQPLEGLAQLVRVPRPHLARGVAIMDQIHDNSAHRGI